MLQATMTTKAAATRDPPLLAARGGSDMRGAGGGEGGYSRWRGARWRSARGRASSRGFFFGGAARAGSGATDSDSTRDGGAAGATGRALKSIRGVDGVAGSGGRIGGAAGGVARGGALADIGAGGDMRSTRLNSSH